MSGTIFYLNDEETDYLIVNVTDEGVIMDVVRGDEVTATVGMMPDEWADTIEREVI